MDEIIKNLKNFVEERKNLQEQIDKAEEKRNELAEERNAKKSANQINNDEEIWSEVNCLGRQITDLGNQSQWFQNQIDKKTISVKEQVYIEINNLIVEEVRKTKIINEQIEENENCIGDNDTIYEQKKQIAEIEETIENLMILKKLVRRGRIEKIISEYEKQVEYVEQTECTNVLNEIALNEIEKIFNELGQQNRTEQKTIEFNAEEFKPADVPFEVEEFETNAESFGVEEFEQKEEAFKVEENQNETEPFTVEEFNQEIEPLEIEELNVEEFEPQIEEVQIDKLQVEEFKDSEKEDEIIDEFQKIVEEANNKKTEFNRFAKIEEQINEQIKLHLAENKKVKEQEIITFEENKKIEDTEKNQIKEIAKIQSIDVKVEDKTIVYKAQINDGSTMKIYPVKEEKYRTEKSDRKLWKEELIRYSISRYRNYDNFAIRKMDPIICEILERFAIKYNQDYDDLVYNYVMSFSNSIEISSEFVPTITYNLSYLGETGISKENAKTIQKLAKNANKNGLIETIGMISTTEKIKLFVKKLFNLNEVKTLTSGNKENY